MPDSDHEEILRLRDWRHKEVDPNLAAYRLRIRALEDRMDKVEPMALAAVERDKLADALAAKITQQRERWYKRVDVWTAVALVLLTAAIVAQGFRGG